MLRGRMKVERRLRLEARSSVERLDRLPIRDVEEARRRTDDIGEVGTRREEVRDVWEGADA